MCGIVGVVAAGVAHNSHLQRMVSALRHRGPDGEATHCFSHCGLGHTRLSIVDLATGSQPMLSEDRNVAITFNGEIYGYREIRTKLRDYQFHTTSDTEVILALHQLYGRDLLRHLPGMFAFAIWDDREQSLFAARDRFGEKPFYYAWGPEGEFVFGSEIKALIASGLIRPKINRAALAHYLRHLYVHPNETVFSNVFVLPPAHFLSLKKGQLTVERYWQLPPMKEPISEREAIDEFRRLFEQAVSRQLVADVPVGAFLSGGLDSSSVVAAACRIHPKLQTFSFGFRDSVNELPYAKEIAELYGTEHVELQDQGTDVADLLLEMASVYDEPFADSSNIPTYLISQAASRYTKVALTGDGGDELLAGYDFWYQPLLEMQHTKALAAGGVGLARLAERISYKVGIPTTLGVRRVIRGASLCDRYQSIAEAHAAQNVFFTNPELHELCMNGQAQQTSSDRAHQFTDTVDDALRMDLCDYLPGDILVKTDRASMAHGLELRAPLLDVDLASFCVSLPSRLKITAQSDKLILRRCYSDAWTDSIRTRKKCGFGAPVEQWLKRHSVVKLKKAILGNSEHPLFSLIPFKACRQFAAKDNYQTWALLTLGLWLERGRDCYL